MQEYKREALHPERKGSIRPLTLRKDRLTLEVLGMAMALTASILSRHPGDVLAISLQTLAEAPTMGLPAPASQSLSLTLTYLKLLFNIDANVYT